MINRSATNSAKSKDCGPCSRMSWRSNSNSNPTRKKDTHILVLKKRAKDTDEPGIEAGLQEEERVWRHNDTQSKHYDYLDDKTIGPTNVCFCMNTDALSGIQRRRPPRPTYTTTESVGYRSTQSRRRCCTSTPQLRYPAVHTESTEQGIEQVACDQRLDTLQVLP